MAIFLKSMFFRCSGHVSLGSFCHLSPIFCLLLHNSYTLLAFASSNRNPMPENVNESGTAFDQSIFDEESHRFE